MAGQVRPIPEGYHTATPYLTVKDGARAIEFYKRAFGAQEKFRMAGPDGRVAHAEIQIGNSIVMLGDEMPGSSCRSPQSLNGTTSGILLYVTDVDTAFNQAVQAGAKAEMPVQDMFWGDRYGRLVDPFGHSWSVATHKEDVAPADMQKRAQEAMSKMATQSKRAG
jgi:PhnB protein